MFPRTRRSLLYASSGCKIGESAESGPGVAGQKFSAIVPRLEKNTTKRFGNASGDAWLVRWSDGRNGIASAAPVAARRKDRRFCALMAWFLLYFLPPVRMTCGI